jgi:DNA repair protein RadC
LFPQRITTIHRRKTNAVHAPGEEYQHQKQPVDAGWTARRSIMQQPEFFKRFQPPKPRNKHPAEWRIVALRECPVPADMVVCDNPEGAAGYWRAHIEKAPYYNPEVESFIVLHLNTRRRITGHHLVSIGTLDTILVHPREVFRASIIAAAGAIVLMHNHPSGEPTPSEADVKVTRDLIRAGQLLKIEVLDHVIVGKPGHTSLRELGYFTS